MNEQVRQLVERLQSERTTRGRITQIAKEAGVTTRTLQNLMDVAEYSPNVSTLDKLTDYFKKSDRRAAK